MKTVLRDQPMRVNPEVQNHGVSVGPWVPVPFGPVTWGSIYAIAFEQAQRSVRELRMRQQLPGLN